MESEQKDIRYIRNTCTTLNIFKIGQITYDKNADSIVRGGYSESRTVFRIAAHFLNAAARFEEMGVVLR